MKYEGYSVTMQISTQNMDWIIALVGKQHQDRFLDANDYLRGEVSCGKPQADWLQMGLRGELW